ncbi:hypothetical protein FRC20_005721 [Serendipita sp. 405]|nr:hypothetical protein FRC15_005686 [Serendipita sp. 397]KAG8773193.1 hypothetical protein FRC16_005455 [Serendipita sp. 398]KAG8840245.1 hypothetical protein FRC20_005721 [Serendipita sp. 405]
MLIGKGSEAGNVQPRAGFEPIEKPLKVFSSPLAAETIHILIQISAKVIITIHNCPWFSVVSTSCSLRLSAPSTRCRPVSFCLHLLFLTRSLSTITSLYGRKRADILDAGPARDPFFIPHLIRHLPLIVSSLTEPIYIVQPTPWIECSDYPSTFTTFAPR